jgi:probable HAF family extracellular repeat protein
MEAMTAIFDAGNVFAPLWIGALWRTSIGGLLFLFFVWCVCRLIPRLPASTRFWLWWMVSAKLLLGLIFASSALPNLTPFVLRLPAHHPVVAPAFFVARLVVQPTRLLYDNRQHSDTITSPKPNPKPVASENTLPATFGQTSTEIDSLNTSGNTNDGIAAKPAATNSLANPWTYLAGLVTIAWGFGFLWHLRLLVQGIILGRRAIQEAVSAPEPILEEARFVAKSLKLRHLPNIVMHENAASPFLTGFFRPTVVLPASSHASLSTVERRMALAHELTHLRRGDLWLALIPSFAEAAFFFLPIARWAARECALCREEVCDSVAVTKLGNGLLTDYGQLLLKVTLAAQANKQLNPQMSMAVIVSPAFVQLRRRLNTLKREIGNPASPSLRRTATLLLTLSLPGVFPWHLRALPRSAVIEPKVSDDTTLELPRYEIIDLGTLGGKFSDAYHIGENGLIVGTANVYPLGGRGHAFLWRPDNKDTQNGEMTDLCAGSVYRHSLAYGINEKGQVAAAAFNNSSKPNAFLWTSGGAQRRYLGGLPGFHYSRATGINNDGMIVGAALAAETDRRGATRMRAFAWQNGRMQDLGTLGGDFSSAGAISDSGYIVGKSDTRTLYGDATHAVVWEPELTKPRDIGTLSGGKNSAASAVNHRGDVVGFSETFDAPRHAFLYSDDTLEDLGALPAADSSADRISISTASGINDKGWIVGYSSVLPLDDDKTNAPESLTSRAVVWLPTNDKQISRRLVDLNDCLKSKDRWRLESARAINNRGEIVGVGRVEGKRHAFLLRPVKNESIQTPRL